MEELIKLIKQEKKEERIVFVCGNGGSASTAEHFTNDLFARGVITVCLNSSVPMITMIANDYGYKFIYGKQLEAIGNKEDLLITISCSGTSPNIVEAKRVAKEIGMDIYSFETFKEGDKDYEALEDKHLIFAHKVAKVIGKKKI